MEHYLLWHLALLSSVWTLVLCQTTPTPCTVDITESMITGLMRTEQVEPGCEGAWSSLMTFLQKTRNNLTDCREREEDASTDGLSNLSCQQLLDEQQKNANQSHLALDKELRSKSLYEQVELSKVKQEQRRIQGEIDSMRTELNGHYQQLLLLYIDAAETRRAFRYYQHLVSLQQSNLPQQLIKFVYAAQRHENRRLQNLLSLIRFLPTRREKRTLYQLLQPEIMKRPTQNQSSLAMLASLEMGLLAGQHEKSDYKKLRDAMFDYVLTRWKMVRLGGNYRDIVSFATNHPDLYKQIGVQLATVHPNYWWKFSFSQFITYPNKLPLPQQRMEAFQKIMFQLKQRNKQQFTYHLAKFAPQLDVFERFLKGRDDEMDWREDLLKLKGAFADFDKKKDYAYYLKNSSTIVKQHERAAKGNSRNSRRGLSG
uniref:Uncharacterized protein n=1 Tax=Anopheles epiroticus TaxID=199890 RepID=A0A240PM64_9DIPT